MQYLNYSLVGTAPSYVSVIYRRPLIVACKLAMQTNTNYHMAQSKSQFQIYPLSAFGGASAAIKRPQVCVTLYKILNTTVLRTDVSCARQYIGNYKLLV